MQADLLTLALIALQPAETSLDGRWSNPSGSVIISMTSCNDTPCGKVEWASEKAKADARKGGTDPLIGALLLHHIERRSEGRWKARLFVPDLNNSSKVELRLLGPDRLKVTGCLIGRLACKSQIWTRAEAE